MKARYARWSGTQDPFPAAVSADAVMEGVSDDLLAGYSPDQALSRLLRRGLSGTDGLRDLRRRVEEARRRELERMGLEGPLRRVEERLGRIIDRERTALDFSADEAAAALRRDQLDQLPADTGARLAALGDYDWADAQAGADFRALVDDLRRDVAEATFGRLAGSIGSMSGTDLERTQDLLADLNAMIAARERGEDVTDDFARFRGRHGDLLPGEFETLDDLLGELARRMAAMSQLMAGLEPDQRAQLEAMAGQLLGDLDLAFQASQLAQALRRLYPELGWNEGVAGAMPGGRDTASLTATVDWVEHLRAYEDLAVALGQAYPGARLEDIDEEALRRALGEDAARSLRALREIERVLEEAGAAQRRGGTLELTSRGVRRLGERALARIFERAAAGPVGTHRAQGAGGDGELTGSTRPLAHGDPFRLDVARTLYNAIARGGRPRAGPGVRLDAQDFELAEAERRVRATTVLLLDMSFSMPLRGNWIPAKRVALALHSLIASKFPEDRFYVVGFSDYARRLAPRDLLTTGWERVYGTNMQHAFMIARRLLAAHRGTEQQVIMVTDGEPTAHLEGEVPYFAWPPEATTLRYTMAEAARLARTGATLNVFLLDHDPGAAAFVERMVSGYGGRIFYPDLADLGQVVVHDFLRGRRAA